MNEKEYLADCTDCIHYVKGYWDSEASCGIEAVEEERDVQDRDLAKTCKDYKMTESMRLILKKNMEKRRKR